MRDHKDSEFPSALPHTSKRFLFRVHACDCGDLKTVNNFSGRETTGLCERSDAKERRESR